MKLVGIDSGGTSCRVVLCDETGKVLANCTVPGHNPNADGFDALFQMQCPRVAVFIDAAPVAYTVSRIAILLDLKNKIARADSVDSASLNKITVAYLRFEPLQHFGGLR